MTPTRPLPPSALAALAVHRRLLEQWRKAMDLVGPGSVEPHFADAIAAVTGLNATGRWADLGSGAGFPGIALAALHPEATVDLVERRQKRAAFLHAVLAEAGLPNARVVEGDAAALPAGAYDGLVSRAFLPPQELVPLANHLMSDNGRLILMLSKESPTPPAGWQCVETRRYPLEGRERRIEDWRRLPRST